MIAKEDIEELKKIGYIRAYCDKELVRQPVWVGTSSYYWCPWEEHTDAHLDVHEYKEKGNAHCWRCDKRGDIFDVAAAVLKKDVKKDFEEIVRHVAKAVGYELHEGGTAAGGKKVSTRWVGDDPARYRREPVAEEEEEIQFMSEEEVDEVWDAEKRARRERDVLASYAEELGLPFEALFFHADVTRMEYGILGLTPEKRLLFVYTARDNEGRVRMTMTKQRGLAGEAQRFMCNKGAKKQVLFGEPMIEGSEYVIITEGESDTLAARYALRKWAEREGIPPDDGGGLPVVVAKPDAGTFKARWARMLVGKKVILCIDNDDAGIKGAGKTCEVLRRCGVEDIHAWSAPKGVKDVRDAYKLYADAPGGLIDEIFSKVTRI